MADLWTPRLSEYIDGTLPAAERQALEEHLAACRECRSTTTQLRRVMARASALSDRPPTADLWPGIADRIGLTPARHHQPLRRHRWTRRISLTLPQLMAAGVALMLISGGLVGLALRNPGPGSDTVAPGATPRVAALPATTQSQASYELAIDDLQQVLNAGRGQLDSATVRVVEHSLALIDRAIAQARQALAADPANGYLQDHLDKTLRRKLALMRRAADLVTARS